MAGLAISLPCFFTLFWRRNRGPKKFDCNLPSKINRSFAPFERFFLSTKDPRRLNVGKLGWSSAYSVFPDKRT